MDCRPIGYLTATMARHGSRSRGFHGALVVHQQPCCGAALPAWFSFRELEWQLPQAAGNGPDGLRHKGHGHGECNTHPGYVPHVQDDGPEGIQRGAGGGYHFMENHDDDTGRGEEDEQAYVRVCLPPGTARWQRIPALLRSLRGCQVEVPELRDRLSWLLSWFEIPGDMAGFAWSARLVWRLGSGPPPADAVPSSSSSKGTGRGSLPAPGPPFVAARWGTRGPALPDVGTGSSRPGQDEVRGLPPDRLVQSLPRRRPENCWQPSGTCPCRVNCGSWTNQTSCSSTTWATCPKEQRSPR